MVPDDDDQRVKDLLGSTTQADLERWFGLPSFEQLAEAGKPAQVVDEEVEAVRARRAAATGAVDPALLARILHRVEETPETLIQFRDAIEVTVKDIALFDERMVDKGFSIAEPRDVEISDALRDDLRMCVPQALLRDLHRAELDFDKTFELVDFAAEYRLDIVTEVAQAMRTSWALPPLTIAPWREAIQLLADVRVDRARDWSSALASMPNRRVTE